MDLRMLHLVDIAPFCSVVQAPSSPSSHGHANTVHHPVTVPMSFFGYGKAKVPDVVQVQSCWVSMCISDGPTTAPMTLAHKHQD